MEAAAVIDGMRAQAARASRWGRTLAQPQWWSDFLVPAGRATRFYTRAWLDWTSRHRRPGDVPIPRPSLSLALEAALDEVILTGFKLGRLPRTTDVLHRIEDEVAGALALYGDAGWLEDPATFHRAPPPLTDPHLEPARAGDLAYEQLTFESGYRPHPGEPGRERWLGHERNRTAHAWVLRHPEPRPWIVAIHGAGMGSAGLDLRVMRAAWFHRELGLNVALPVMPLHGPRREGGPFSVGFPSDDILDNVHGVSQALWDVRRLLSWIRSRDDRPGGVYGLSLGGYTAALLAGLEPDLACVIAGVPPADFSDLFEAHMPTRYHRHTGYGSLSEISRSLHRVISPLSMVPLVPRHRRFIYAGLADRLVHPQRQVRRLWSHWDQPHITWFEGSHVGFYWASAVLEFLREALVESGLVAEPSGPASPAGGA